MNPPFAVSGYLEPAAGRDLLSARVGGHAPRRRTRANDARPARKDRRAALAERRGRDTPPPARPSRTARGGTGAQRTRVDTLGRKSDGGEGRSPRRGGLSRTDPSPHPQGRGARSSAALGQQAPTACAEGRQGPARQLRPENLDAWQTCEVAMTARDPPPHAADPAPRPHPQGSGARPKANTWGRGAQRAGQPDARREGSRLPSRESRPATSRASAAQTPVAPQCRGKAGCHASGADRPSSCGHRVRLPKAAPFRRSHPLRGAPPRLGRFRARGARHSVAGALPLHPHPAGHVGSSTRRNSDGTDLRPAAKLMPVAAPPRHDRVRPRPLVRARRVPRRRRPPRTRDDRRHDRRDRPRLRA